MQIKNAGADKLLQQQDLIQMYENLNLKNEFLNTLRNYTVLVFTAGDLNKIKDLFVKFGFLDLNLTNEKKSINHQESVTGLLGYLDESTFKQQGIEPEVYHNIQAKKRMKARVIITSEKKYCGYERTHIFKQCILPVLKTICANQSIKMIDLVQEIVS